MANQERSSAKSIINSLIKKGSEQFGYFIHHILSYYAELISHPFKSGLVYFVAGLIPALFIGWILFPVVLYSEQTQPVNFSHAIHTDPDIMEVIEGDTDMERCGYCHKFREDGTFAGIPKLAICIDCHDSPEFPLGETEEEQRFLNEYVADEKEPLWFSYSRQPDCVYFSHIAHVKMGEIACSTCHGPHQQSDELPIYQKNRLTGYSRDIYGRNILGYKANSWDRMKMNDCAECHTEKGYEENNACFVCHK
jgi:hypothetical protein